MDHTPVAVDTVLEVDDLRTVFFTRQGLVKAVDGISFSLRRGEILAIVGESGCGKSMTALSVMRLVPNPPGRIVAKAAICCRSTRPRCARCAATRSR
jgi:peptide/nickel transport system ATP-binding protein